MRELVRASEHDRNLSLGWLAVAWFEHFTVHGPGDVEGQPVVLDDEFAGFTLDAYAHDSQGRRLYDSAFLSRAKGRAKSELAGDFTLFETFGPCRFAGFADGGERYEWRDFTYTYAKGEPMGRPVTYPFVRCLATEEGQAGNTYDNVYYNLTQGPLADGLPSTAAGLTRVILPNGGEIVPSTASSASKDGGKESFCVFDETHIFTLPELIRMYATVRRNLAKRKAAAPWSLETSTMYRPGEDSVAESTHKLAKLIAEGKTKRSRLLFDHRAASIVVDGKDNVDIDMTDEKSVLEGLREAYGPFADVMDLRRLLDEIWDPRNDPSESRRYYFNQPTSALDAWIADHEWNGCLDATLALQEGDTVTLGFDGSRKRSRKVTDATALVACRVSDGALFELAVWEQPNGPAGDGWEVPKVQVDAAVSDAFGRFNVVGFFADPAKWETYVAKWEADFGSQLQVKSSQAHPVEWWMTGGRSIHTVRALDQFHGAVIDKELSHDGAFALTRHVLNARRRPSKVGLQIGKENPDSPKKIDAAIAAVLAWDARLAAVAKGVTDVKKKSRRIRRY